ncbi:MAG TPA: threonine synthase, partial [Humisphaera sp.]|nr:threonine synthase [Humisphaera sp.]
MSYVLGLKCKECGHRVPVSPVHVCEACFGPYEVEYDYAKMKGKVTRASIEAGPKSLWRYKDLLPVEGQPKVGLHSGFTPLKRATRLAKELGCRELYIKDDSCNYPTYSYKERVVSVAISKAVEFGFDTVGCASTGNLANSTAAHAAQAGIRCFVMIPHDLEQGKVLGSLIFGPTMVRIKGNYDDVNRLCTEIADKYGWAIVNVNLRPYYTEGAKTYGFEIAEQLGWALPQHTVVPTAGGTILPKIYKAYRELVEIGLVQDTSAKIYSAQAAGCNPVVTAIQKGIDIIEPQKPNTIAKSIAIGNPADGYYAAQVVRDSGGWGESASDREIVDAIKLLAETEGIWT